MTKSFTHLHVHSEHSRLDGLGRIKEYIAKAKELGMTALAITDHGETSGCFELWKECQGSGIKPILGTEFYIKTEYGRGHLVALAMNNTGWKNILKLQRYAYSDRGFDTKPCVDIKSLRKHNEGIIITSACRANPISHLILSDQEDEALEVATDFQNIFGDRFYIELQSSKSDLQKTANQGLLRIANKIGAEVIVTNDCHYVDKKDAFAHEVLLAIQTKKQMSEPARFKFDSDQYYFKSYDEMCKDVHVPDTVVKRALANTNVIAERCNASIEPGLFFPEFPCPKGETSESLLRRMVTKNYKEKILGDGLHSQNYMGDVTTELGVICEEGYADYFLIVQDYVNWARSNKIVVGDGRGSGVSSKVAYTMGITAVNPEPHNLLFERFISNGRHADFDVDFSDRDRVIEYLATKYGDKNIAKIGNINRLKTKAVIKKVLSTFGHPSYYANSVTRDIDDNDSLDQVMEHSKLFKKHVKSNPVEKEVIWKLHDIISHDGRHAGGVLIYPNIAELVPVRTLSDNRKRLITTIDKKALEWLGHIKFDLLGLESLTVIEEALKSIQAESGKYIDLSKIGFTDKGVYDLLSAGDSSGVFQLAGQAHMLMEQKPFCFDDLVAVNAMLRPGVGDWKEYVARRNGKKFTIHPARKPYLSETYGIIAYQEQYELDCKTFAGWTIAYADKHVRKNKDLRADTELRDKFVKDSMARGFAEPLVTRIWDEIVHAASGGYSFNKAHALSYAILSYQTAWLKLHYPEHFYAALMTKEGGDQDELANLVAEARRRGLEIVSPDINTSTDKFRANNGKIYYRITSVDQVGDSAINAIEQARPINTVEELISRTARKDLKTNVLMSLAKAGCFDSIDPNRHKIMNRIEKALEIDVVNYGEFDVSRKAVLEKQSLGVYLSAHPLSKFKFDPFYEIKDNSQAIIGAEVADIAIRKDKSGRDMAFITLSNQYGNVKGLVFSSNWTKSIEEVARSSQFVIVVGKKSGKSLLIDKMKRLEL